MEFFCYILYSPSIDRFYIGETENLSERLELHNSGFFKGSFTIQASDWSVFLVFPCQNRIIARKIEAYIKSMKSRKYIVKLKNNSQVYDELIHKFI